MNNYKICCCVVLYNPSSSFFLNLDSYLPKMNIILVDNSTKRNDHLFVKRSYLEYIYNEKNLGIAMALNIAAEIAISKGYNFLLIFDQDSFPHDKFIEKYEGFLNDKYNQKIGILTPHFLYKNYRSKIAKKNHTVKSAMTSGSLLNLNAYKATGPFLNKLFIDYVDFEYCLRLLKRGFEIWKVKDAFLYHNLGEIETRKFLFKDITVTNHSPLRYYYRTRNRFYLAKKYFFFFPLIILRDQIIFLNELVKILLYEDFKKDKVKMIFKGVIDFMKNKYGEKI